MYPTRISPLFRLGFTCALLSISLIGAQTFSKADAGDVTPVAPSAPAEPPASAPIITNSSVANTLTIGPYDTLHMEMDGQPDLSHDYVVDSNGDLQMQYVGKIPVGGLTVDQAQAVITTRFKKIYQDVSLTLSRTALGGVSVTVTGSVSKVGPISVRRDAHLNDVIQQLGPLPDADLQHIQVTHANSGPSQSSTIIDLASYLETGNTDGNPYVLDGDTVFVPGRPKVTIQQISVSVIGAVAKPGRFDVPLGTTVYDAVTMAGGLTTSADGNNAYIQPLDSTDHTLVKYSVAASSPGLPDANPVLKDGDKLVIPEVPNISTYSIIGAVRNPNTFPMRGNTTLLDAITASGGFVDNAKSKEITVTRIASNGTVSTTKVDGSDPNKAAVYIVQPNDHINVPSGGSGSHRLDPLAVIGVLGTLVAIFH